jgi:transcriptional regulator with XRE-family HTH domain
VQGINIDAERFRRLRILRGLSQVELAEKAGLTQVTISRIERGYPAIFATLEKAAEVLEVQPEWLRPKHPLDIILDEANIASDRPRTGRPRGTKMVRS